MPAQRRLREGVRVLVPGQAGRGGRRARARLWALAGAVAAREGAEVRGRARQWRQQQQRQEQRQQRVRRRRQRQQRQSAREKAESVRVRARTPELGRRGRGWLQARRWARAREGVRALVPGQGGWGGRRMRAGLWALAGAAAAREGAEVRGRARLMMVWALGRVLLRRGSRR